MCLEILQSLFVVGDLIHLEVVKLGLATFEIVGKNFFCFVKLIVKERSYCVRNVHLICFNYFDVDYSFREGEVLHGFINFAQLLFLGEHGCLFRDVFS